ncbi:MAG: hypothetical protein GX540_04265 [Clostridiales bacterium]|nr:hypothetical protein [Clostridiales bacterium]
MAHTSAIVLGIVKARLNRLASDDSLDSYLGQRIQAADQELERTGILLEAGSVRDQVLLADLVVWQYQNRDKPGGMPDWLRLARRDRWLQQKQAEDEAAP